eukprot:5485197-Alexandrium_andersonii.AAC.1
MAAPGLESLTGGFLGRARTGSRASHKCVFERAALALSRSGANRLGRRAARAGALAGRAIPFCWRARAALRLRTEPSESAHLSVAMRSFQPRIDG